MYWISVKCSSDIVAGDVLTHDTSTENTWIKANSLHSPLGVARSDAQLDQDTEDQYFVDIVMQGPVYAKASRDIPQSGGELNVETGGVFVDNTTDHPGFISPNNLNAASRLAGDLVQVIIR